MITEFVKKCNLDKNSVLLNINSGSRNKLLFSGRNIFNFNLNIEDKITLDMFCVNNSISKIDFIHMDLEACENLINLGGNKILESTEYIYTEYLHEELFESQNQLEDENLIKLLSGRWRIINEVTTRSNVLLENVEYRDNLIQESGAWNIKNSNEHIFDVPLANKIVEFLYKNNINNCLDLGCGNGKYTDFFNSKRIDTKGYDGNPFTPELTNNSCKVLDISKKFNLGKKFDCVMCLEVGEHIPPKYESALIENIIRHSRKLVILSWAVPNQGGYGHVNCRDNEYIKGIFKKCGFTNIKNMEEILREVAECTWFRDTIMVFQAK